MSYPKHGRFLCPGCGAETNIEYTEHGLLVANINLVINNHEFDRYKEGKTPPEGPGNLRPDELSTPVHESVHGQAPG